MTNDGQLPMPSEEQNCQALVTVTGDDVTNSVKVIPRLETLVSLSAVAMTTDLNNNHHHVKMVAQHKNEKYCKTVKNQISTRRFNQALFSVREGAIASQTSALFPNYFGYRLTAWSTSTPLCRIEPSADSAVQTVNRRRSSTGRGSTVLEQAS